ncbi:MAG: ABC transporter ATP-binding protein [Ancrocorticia sp.]|uniref:ABC transporter ATP-binding protein n=1 Tax=Ancrocorticia sp. TaxID=2593684 RepID=UPI003F8F5685
MAALNESLAGSVSPNTSVLVDDVSISFKVNLKSKEQEKTNLFGFSKKENYLIDAVKGVSFSAEKGEVVGVIGTNGSGKSTLMRAVAGLEMPTSGNVYATAKPVLLSIGASLIRELSGDKNILLGCLAMGMSLDEARAIHPKIVEFSGLGESIGLPMRTYSSGMSARLRFSITTAVPREILIVDEALAVGDADFRTKSAARIQQLKEAAGTVFIVSHSMKEIVSNCTRVLWLNKGDLMADGDPKGVIGEYREFRNPK